MANFNVFVILSLMAVGLGVFTYIKDPALTWSGLREGGDTLVGILPVLIPAFLVGGLLPKVLPQELMGRWLGDESGLRGIVVATFVGAATPGGPFVAFPVVAGLLKSGAGVAPMAAFITAWGSLAFNRVFVFDIPMLGWKFTLARLAATLVFPMMIGFITKLIYERM